MNIKLYSKSFTPNRKVVKIYPQGAMLGVTAKVLIVVPRVICSANLVNIWNQGGCQFKILEIINGNNNFAKSKKYISILVQVIVLEFSKTFSSSCIFSSPCISILEKSYVIQRRFLQVFWYLEEHFKVC